MGVEQAVQPATCERIAHQFHGLLGMAAIARVHDGRVVVADEEDVVGREPAAFENGDFWGEQVVWRSSGHEGESEGFAAGINTNAAPQSAAQRTAGLACPQSSKTRMPAPSMPLDGKAVSGCAQLLRQGHL